ncbi:MAG: hypothetical protein K2H52_05225 [Lachnospiraceae bacterium]|nr:hypothetical protein [Lachnospiraceae bacterium]MDE6184030.1 hypothetical protein [Lachnospiraceae bacterium]
MTGLKGEYIRVKRHNGGIITYGGDQGFFSDASADPAEARKRRMGCGIVAFGDLLLYLAGQNSQYRFKGSEHYVNRVLSEEAYKDYFNDRYVFLGGLPAKAGKGLSGFRLQGRFNRMAKSEGWKLYAKWGLSSRKLYGRMIEMLEKDIPVILCIPLMIFKKDKEHGITFYKKEEKGYSKACTVSAHYVVVTELLEEQDEIYMGISSWGMKYYVNWREYDQFIHTHFMGTILGNLLYIK